MLVQFSGPHLYRSAIFLSPFVFSLSRDRTYIDRSLSCQLESGVAPILIGHLPCQFSSSRDRTYIDRPFPCHVSSVSGTAPISIGHLFVSSVRVWTAPILIGHSSCQSSRDRTYIDRPSSYQFSSSRDRTYIDRSLSCQFESGPHPYRPAIFLSVCV